ncbi:MAG: hypothetical protein WBX15_14305 [Thermoanaerobaculia bacterium]
MSVREENEIGLLLTLIERSREQLDAIETELRQAAEVLDPREHEQFRVLVRTLRVKEQRLRGEILSRFDEADPRRTS